MEKLRKNFRKFKKEYYKWEAYFAKPKSAKYTKEIEEFDKEIANFYARNFKRLQNKLKKMAKLEPLKIENGLQRDQLKKKLENSKKILLVDCYAEVLFNHKAKYQWKYFNKSQ